METYPVIKEIILAAIRSGKGTKEIKEQTQALFDQDLVDRAIVDNALEYGFNLKTIAIAKNKDCGGFND